MHNMQLAASAIAKCCLFASLSIMIYNLSFETCNSSVIMTIIVMDFIMKLFLLISDDDSNFKGSMHGHFLSFTWEGQIQR